MPSIPNLALSLVLPLLGTYMLTSRDILTSLAYRLPLLPIMLMLIVYLLLLLIFHMHSRLVFPRTSLAALLVYHVPCCDIWTVLLFLT